MGAFVGPANSILTNVGGLLIFAKISYFVATQNNFGVFLRDLNTSNFRSDRAGSIKALRKIKRSAPVK